MCHTCYSKKRRKLYEEDCWGKAINAKVTSSKHLDLQPHQVGSIHIVLRHSNSRRPVDEDYEDQVIKMVEDAQLHGVYCLQNCTFDKAGTYSSFGTSLSNAKKLKNVLPGKMNKDRPISELVDGVAEKHIAGELSIIAMLDVKTLPTLPAEMVRNNCKMKCVLVLRNISD